MVARLPVRYYTFLNIQILFLMLTIFYTSIRFCYVCMDWLLVNGTICAQGTAGTGLTISAPYGSVLNTALFASYGEPSGSCPDMSYNDWCHARASVAVVDALCSGKTSCTIVPSAGLFEQDPCPYNPKWLAVVMSYSPQSTAGTCESLNLVVYVRVRF